MSREKQIEEMAKALTAYEKKLCDRLPKDKCLLASAIHAQVSCDYCKIAEFLVNEGYRKQSEWISVEERLPENYEHCLLFLDNETMEIGWYHESAKKFVVGGLITISRVTHWMPLPEAPKGGTE